jgi:outer membrane protein W
MLRRVLSCLLLSICCTAAAQAEGRISVLGSYWDLGEPGAVAGLGLRGSFGGQRVQIVTGATWYQNETLVARNGELLHRLDIDVLPFDAGLRYRFRKEGLVPYAGAGLSYFLLDVERTSTDDELGYYGAVGVDGDFGRRLGMVLELMYRKAQANLTFSRSEGFQLDRSADVDLGGLALNVGLSWRW